MSIGDLLCLCKCVIRPVEEYACMSCIWHSSLTVEQSNRIESFQKHALKIITGIIARSATCRYLSYSEADFEVFRPAGATRRTDGGEIWHAGGPILRAKFYPHRCNGKGTGPPKLKFLLRFNQKGEYKRPAGAYPLRDFHKFAEFVRRFRCVSDYNFVGFAQGVMELWAFKLTRSGYSQIFSAP